jgi:hypothetical protein
MSSRFITVPLIGFALLMLGVAAATHFGPLETPFGFIVVESKFSDGPLVVVGVLMLIIGFAIETYSQKKK